MSDDLTRDEIKAACEAVGWRWVEEDESWVPRDSWAIDEDDISRFEAHSLMNGRPTWPSHTDGDATALLNATGERWQCGRSIGKEEPYFALIPGQPHMFGPDLKTAAVRAVNQWAETKKETP